MKMFKLITFFVTIFVFYTPPHLAKAMEPKIEYRLEDKKVTKKQFERFKSGLNIDQSSMAEGTGPYTNIQYWKAEDKMGYAYKYSLQSNVDQSTGDETQTRKLERVN